MRRPPAYYGDADQLALYEEEAMRTGYGHMVHDDYVARVRVVHARRQARLQAIRTREEALAYQQEVRQSLKRIFAPRPPKTPLNVRVTGVNEHPAYRVEKLLFDSRPGYTVAANLYLPHNLSGPAPAVLGTCGHSAEGKALPLYQAFCVRLALAGFVVLIYDPVNQGERDQYALLQDRQLVESCTHAHNMMGKQLELIGENLTMWRTWDGIRALDYLLSRPEVDPARVGGDGQFRRRDDDHVAVGCRGAVQHGGPQLLCDHHPAQPGERTPRRRGAIPAGAVGGGPGTGRLLDCPRTAARAAAGAAI
jgi:hypothetical protein